MRIIHTADVHLDTCFAGAGLPPAYGNRRRQSLRDVFHSVIARAGAWPADALLVAGDLFEHEHVSADTVAFLLREFASIPHVQVYIAPGNHDPFVNDSPYAAEQWPSNVTIFREPVWRSSEHPSIGLTVHGFAFDGPDISRNPYGALNVPTDGRVHVAVAHGSERSRQPAAKTSYAPFSADEAAVDGLVYLGLGHFHSVTQITGAFDTAIWYSGAPQGRGYDEIGPHHFLEVEVNDGRAHITPVVASQVEFRVITVDCSGLTTSQDITDQLRQMADQSSSPLIARVTLTGTAGAPFVATFEAVRDALNGQFEYLELVDRTVPEEDFDALGRERTALGMFVARVNEEIADTTDPERKQLLERARLLGVAAYRGVELPIAGLEGGAV